MVIWYKNSFLASVLSMGGCALIIAAIGEMISGSGELSGGSAFLAMGIGVALAILGKKVSDNKAKNQEQEQQEKLKQERLRRQKIEELQRQLQELQNRSGGNPTVVPVKPASEPARTQTTQSSQTLVCSKCGKVNVGESQFCGGCGQRPQALD